MKNFLLQTIISGGQTGVDQLGLEVARLVGISTGGIAPKGYLTENGPNDLLRDIYGLTEHTSVKYDKRTRANVQHSDGTVLFGDVSKGGTKLTLDSCVRENKPHIINPRANELRAWLIEHQVKVLNVAGNRGSSLSIDQIKKYRQILYDVFVTDRRLAALFQEQPTQWGLRGDPYLWAELEQVGRTLLIPSTELELRDLLAVLFKNLTGVDLVPEVNIRVERYCFGGMSSGIVNANFWLEEAIPLLQQRLTSMQL